MRTILFFTSVIIFSFQIVSAQGDDIPNLDDVMICADTVDVNGDSNTYMVTFDFDGVKTNIQNQVEKDKYAVSFSSQPNGAGVSLSGQMVIPTLRVFTSFNELGTGAIYEVSFFIMVQPIPIINLTGDFSICEENSSTRIDTNPSGDYTYEWYFNGNLLPTTTKFIEATEAGNYSVVALDPINYCPAEEEFTIVQITCADTDSDGVIDIDEDINNNGNLDDDDTDGDTVANYLDSDDDGDRVPTLVEVTVTSTNSRQKHTFIDTDGDQIQNYLDDDDDGDKILTKDEDYNNNGDPTDDDTDNSGIADYLESDVFLSHGSEKLDRFKIYPNPAKSLITVNFVDNFSKIRILDIHGKQVIARAVENSEKKIILNIESLKSGLYILVIDSRKQSFHKKLLVQ
ncbi:MAG: T9SS type A sorting domain-containing protein [Leeuwenhoekiella sp.]